jgi:DNA (cytosine-5)-methyltransferase 3A
MNVLSLFDGMSCGQQALQRQGIKVDNYYASEIDKYAISITQKNYPGTIQLGSVVNVDVTKLERIDLLIGGSPCQSFSFAGKRKGMSTKDEIEILTLNQYLELKEQNFEFEGQSYLFWEYMRILTDIRKINPDVKFLLENVMMGEKWEKVLSKAIGVNPIEINSALVSAQNRRRLYWTNIGMKPSGLFGDLESIIVQPNDQCILLKDILESEVDEKYFLSDARINTIAKSIRKVEHLTNDSEKHNSLIAGYAKIPTDGQYLVHNLMPRSSTTGKGGTGHLSRNDGKTYCLDTGNTNAVELREVRQLNRGIIQHIIPEIVSVRKYEVDVLGLQKILKEHKNLNNQQIANYLNVPKTMVEHWFRSDTSFSIPSKDIWMKLKELLEINANEFDDSIMTFEEKESVFEKTNRVYDEDGIAPTLTSTSADERILVREYRQSRIRRLTPTECERLQTVKDGYTEGVSDTQRYRMLGNGWTVEVIKHIFSYLNI